jgi:hypothetical protein
MDYISEKLKEKIKLAKAQSNVKDIIQYSSVFVQYYLFLSFSLLFNADWKKGGLPINKRNLHRPSLGTILDLCRILNNPISLFKKWKEVDKVFSAYINLRNNTGQGHGFDFTHDNQKQLEELNKIVSQLEKLESLFSRKYNIVCVQDSDELTFKGISYSSNGKIYPWTFHKDQKMKFEKGEIYLQSQNGILSNLTKGAFFENILEYQKISPFIKIEQDDFWLFQSVREPLSGTIKYNNIFRTSQTVFEYSSFKNFGLVTADEFSMRQISLNGSIRNNYEINYKDFISIYDKDSFVSDVLEFLKSKSSSVATIWGHGGVGKTATLQNISEKLFLESRGELERKNLYFNYIIFLSAKDRRYNFITGQIENIDGDKLTDFNDFIIKINEIIFNQSSADESKIIDDFIGKLLIFIDDFETFSNDERKKILSFSDKLDINRHKIIISSRLTTTTGKEIEKKELNEDDTIKFLKAVLETQFHETKELFDLDEQQTIYNIFKITSGRPLFIFHFAYLLMQNQNVEEITSLDIKSTRAATEFLYGRLYSYLDEDSQTLYKILGFVVSKTDLLCRVNNLQYLLGMDGSRFQKCVSVLEKLRIITLSESRDFLSIYSPEILTNMEQKIKEDNKLHTEISNKLKNDSFIVMGSSKSIFQQKLDGIRIKAKIEKKITDVVDGYELLIRDSTFSHDDHLIAFEELINYLIHKNIDYGFALNICNEFSLYFKNDSKYCIKYFETLRDAGKLAEAISLAKNFIDNIDEISYSNYDYFILAGRYLELISKSLINRKDELNDKMSELVEEEFSKMAYSLKTEMIALTEQSKIIFLNLVKISYSNLSRKQKNAISTGFFSLVKMMRRTLRDKNQINIERQEVFNEICSYGINHFSPEMRDQLINIKYQVEHNDFENSIKKVKKPDEKLSDFGKQLLQALDKKNS